jgi:hypothetical protein
MRMHSFGLVCLASLIGPAALGCGSTTDDNKPASGPQGGPAPTAPVDTTTPSDESAPVVDHGSPSDTYPAFPVDVGQLVNNGGHVLTNPVIVTITWSGDPNVEDYESFGDAIGTTDYWKQVTAEYGVGQGTSGTTNHVRVSTAAPASFADDEIEQFVADNAGATTTSGWPAPTADTVYVMYLPKSTALKLQGQEACSSGVGGYHDSVAVNGKQVAYAVIPHCEPANSIEESTVAASHELGEAAVDPFPMRSPGWTGFDDDHLSFEFFQQLQSENGDACEFFDDSYLQSKEPSFPFVVQRQWSNASAKAGHNPCVPAPSAVYFNVTPLGAAPVTIDLSRFGGSSKAKTHGFKASVGESVDIELGFFSDAPKEPWTIKAYEGNPLLQAKPANRIDLTLDKTSGQNGEKSHLVVTVKEAGRTGTELVTIEANDGRISHYMPLLISSPPKP